MMKTLRGKPVSGGIAVGEAVIWRSQAKNAERRKGTPEHEFELFLSARRKAAGEMHSLAEKTAAEAGEDAAEVLEAQAMMAEDPELEEKVRDRIMRAGMCAEQAVRGAAEDLAGMLESLDDEYMRGRGADVRAIAKHLESHISGMTAHPMELPEKAVIIASDLSPSETIQMDRSRIMGIALSAGAADGHTAILARMLGIPAVMGLGQTTDQFEGCRCSAIVDGSGGLVILDPDEKTVAEYRKKQKAEELKKSRLKTLRDTRVITREGRGVKVYGNIGRPEDVEDVLRCGGEGIGLFRSEFLFIGAVAAPNEETQYGAYRKVLERMNGLEVIIRTCDLGADKRTSYLNTESEENPALGLRGIRLCLERPEFFRTQLRALYRASVCGRLSIMFPMISSLRELREAKALCAAVRAELVSEGRKIAPDVRLGIMIETPAAALESDSLAAEADFFSLGTNDLTQYTLACDRQNTALERYTDPRHPAILKLIRRTADSAHRHNIPVGVCGELAADAGMAGFFLENGIDELSVSPPDILPVRGALLEIMAKRSRENN